MRGNCPNYIAPLNNVRKLKFVSFDLEASWKGLFDDLMLKLKNDPSWRIETDSNCIKRDLTTYEPRDRYDIVFISWVLSELKKSSDMNDMLHNALTACKDGGYIMVLERTEANMRQRIIDYFNEIPEVKRKYRNMDVVSGHCGVHHPQSIVDKFSPKLSYDSNDYIYKKNYV
jgi:hypothetical protein